MWATLRAVSDRELRDTVVDDLAPPSSMLARHEACLVVLYGEDLGRRIPLGPRAAVVVGRTQDCQVVLDDETVSRRHARFASARGRYAVEDLGATNGVHVNDAAVTHARPLDDGDQVRVGRTIFKFLQGGNIEADYHEVIYQLMTNDALTHAHNRRYFEGELARETSRAARYGRPLALVTFDVDHFKAVNDTHGHLGGDEVLRQLGTIVRSLVRREDVFARVGGEEFALLVPEGTLSGAGLLAERLRERIASTPFLVEGRSFTVTCSFGVAFFAAGAVGSPRELVERADAALYAAKAAGRNCVRT